MLKKRVSLIVYIFIHKGVSVLIKIYYIKITNNKIKIHVYTYTHTHTHIKYKCLAIILEI